MGTGWVTGQRRPLSETESGRGGRLVDLRSIAVKADETIPYCTTAVSACGG